MSQIPDGVGQNADSSKSNAGPPDSVLLSNTADTVASTGQEQQGQLPGLLECSQTGTKLAYQQQFLKFVNEEQIHSAKQQIDDYNQSHVDQETQTYSVPEPEIKLNKSENLVEQETQTYSVPEPQIEANKLENLVEQETQTDSVPEPEIEEKKKHNLVEQETQTYSEPEIEEKKKQNLVEQETQTDSVPEPEREFPKELVPVHDHNQNFIEQAALWNSVPVPTLEINQEAVPVAEEHDQIFGHNQYLFGLENQTYSEFRSSDQEQETEGSPATDHSEEIIELSTDEGTEEELETEGSPTTEHSEDDIELLSEEETEKEQKTEGNPETEHNEEDIELLSVEETEKVQETEQVLETETEGNPATEHSEKEKALLNPLERTIIAVHNSFPYLRAFCELEATKRHPEEEGFQPQIKEIVSRLLDLCPHLIRHPDPKAWSLYREIVLNIDAVPVFSDRPVQKARAEDIAEPPATSMGLEVLNRIRKIIFGWYTNDTQADPDEAGSGSGPVGGQHLRNTRKRRTAEDEPPLIKYRRVDNSFPRFIPNEVAEDPVPSKSMADREREKENPRQFAKRLSIFNKPTLTQQRVRNNASNINVDLSDDDEQMPSFGPGASYRPPPPPPPPLTDLTSMNSDSTPSLAMRSPQMLYSDAVRLGQNGFPESRMNGHPTPTNPIRSPGHGEDSLLNQQDRQSEHEQYLALLRNVCNKSAIRAINNTKPPPLQLLNRAAAPERSTTTTWGSILANNKPLLSRQKQSPPSPPPPPKPASKSATPNRDFANYCKLLEREQKKSSPPPLMRMDSNKSVKSVKSVTSHSSTISISGSSSSSSNSSTASDIDQANDNNSAKEKSAAAAAPAAACQANDTKAAIPSKQQSPKDDSNSDDPAVSYAALQRRFANCRFYKDNFAEDFKKLVDKQQKERDHRRQLAVIQAEETAEVRREYEKNMRSNIFQFRLTYKPLLVYGIRDKAKDEKVSEFIPLTEEHMQRFNELFTGPPHQVIVSKFSLQITRSDIRTLLGSSWLNDEVINFYMNLLTERSELRSGELPSVYAMNTFFVPRLLQNGHGGVKRWTRKVDLFSKDIIPVPVHCNGVHWCMAVIHMRNKTIRYYDSMGKPNQDVLDALESYLRQESLDKRKQPFDTSSFKIESVPNVPQQTNGSDCGVFSCMFAEYISRDAPITFSQDNMDYFRKKMVLEIADGKLWK